MVAAALVLLVGAAFGLIGALGLLRMPDLPMRLHAMSKAGTVGAGLMLTGVAMFHNEFGITTRAVVTVLFVILTGSVAAHVIARSAYFSRGMKLWEGTRGNELEGRYDVQARSLASRADEDADDTAGDGAEGEAPRPRAGEATDATHDE